MVSAVHQVRGSIFLDVIFVVFLTLEKFLLTLLTSQFKTVDYGTKSETSGSTYIRDWFGNSNFNFTIPTIQDDIDNNIEEITPEGKFLCFIFSVDFGPDFSQNC